MQCLKEGDDLILLVFMKLLAAENIDSRSRVRK